MSRAWNGFREVSASPQTAFPLFPGVAGVFFVRCCFRNHARGRSGGHYPRWL